MSSGTFQPVDCKITTKVCGVNITDSASFVFIVLDKYHFGECYFSYFIRVICLRSFDNVANKETTFPVGCTEKKWQQLQFDRINRYRINRYGC